MIRRLYKHKLLLDENFPARTKLPKLNELYDVKHLRDDLGITSITDPQVYAVAVKQCRLVVTFNAEDFRPLAEKRAESGVIGISTNLTNKQIDTKLVAFLRKQPPKRLYGAFHYISAES